MDAVILSAFLNLPANLHQAAMPATIKSTLGPLELPEGYIQIGSGDIVKADDAQGNPRNFSGWKPVVTSLIGKEWCPCWATVIIRRPTT